MSRLNFRNLWEEIFKLSRKKPSFVFLWGIRRRRSVHSLDREGLTWSCLAVSENGRVVPLDARVNHLNTNLLEHSVLRNILVGYEIKSVLLWVFGVEHDDFFVLNFSDASFLSVVELHNLVTTVGGMVRWGQRPYPYDNLNVLTLGGIRCRITLFACLCRLHFRSLNVCLLLINLNRRISNFNSYEKDLRKFKIIIFCDHPALWRLD